jgi:hypothetical protein
LFVGITEDEKKITFGYKATLSLRAERLRTNLTETPRTFHAELSNNPTRDKGGFKVVVAVLNLSVNPTEI